MKIPANIKHDMTYFKFENHFLCHNCNQYAAKFTYLKFHDDRIHWLFNCTGCGEDFKYMMTFDKLLELYFQCTGVSDKTQVERYWLWECYRLGLYFDTVFQHAADKDDYNNIICKLNKDTSGWRGYWYRWKYAA